MKITDVRAVQPYSPTSPPDWRTSLGQILVAVDTDAGLTGYGVGGGGKAGIHVVRTVLRDVLLGQKPLPVEERWQQMYDATLPFGRKGLAIMALSGVDLALWDLYGKSTHTSIAQLLGGIVHRRIPTYVTVWGAVSADTAAKYHAFKLHTGESARADRLAEVTRDVQQSRTVIGPDRPLMVDAWMKWDLESTLQIANRVAPFKLDWIEEPLSPDDLDGYAVLRDRCPIPIAGGEHEFTAHGFKDLIEKRLHRVLQPDVCWCGGLTEVVKIYNMAKKAGLRVCPHRGAEVWSLPALAALDPQPLAESGRPWMTWVAGQPPIVDGYIDVPDAPGFGVVIDEANLRTI